MKCFLAVAAALAIGGTGARAAPAHLLNKTAVVSFTVTVPAKGPDGVQHVTSRTTSRVIYISSQGRVFVKLARRSRMGSQDKEIAPERGGGHLAFQGDRLVGVMTMISGASQLTVSFDPSGASCTASLITGSDNGRPITFKGLNGQTYTATSKPSVSGVSCSVSAGNRLAG